MRDKKLRPPRIVKIAGKADIASLQRSIFENENLRGADLSGRRLDQFASVGSHFERCDFSGSTLKSCSFGSGTKTSKYIDCVFDSSRIEFSSGGIARFVRCSFKNVELRNWFCFTVELVDCTFSGGLNKVIFNGRVPEDDRRVAGRSVNQIEGNDFSGADFVDVGFRTGVDLSKQRLPDGPKYLYVPNAERAIGFTRSRVLAWEDSEDKKSAISMLRALDFESSGGQRQLLLYRDDYLLPNGQSQPADAVIHLLAQAGNGA